MTVTLPVDIFAQERLSVFTLLSNYCPKNGVTVGGRNEEIVCVCVCVGGIYSSLSGGSVSYTASLWAFIS